MLSNIDLNVVSGGQDILNIFIGCKLNSFNGFYWMRNGLFGHDNNGYDKFVSFGPSGDLVAASTTKNVIVIGSNTVNYVTPIANYQIKANARNFNIWCCLSVHWDVPAGANKSSVWCNGKELCNFTARTSSGSNHMIFGDRNPNGIAGLDGSIAFLDYTRKEL